MIHNASIGCRKPNLGRDSLLHVFINTLVPHLTNLFLQLHLSVAATEIGQQTKCVLLDTEAETTSSQDFVKSNSQPTPFIGLTLQGWVAPVILEAKCC